MQVISTTIKHQLLKLLLIISSALLSSTASADAILHALTGTMTR